MKGSEIFGALCRRMSLNPEVTVIIIIMLLHKLFGGLSPKVLSSFMSLYVSECVHMYRYLMVKALNKHQKIKM